MRERFAEVYPERRGKQRIDAGGWPIIFRDFAVGARSFPLFGKGRGSGHPFDPAFDVVVVSSSDSHPVLRINTDDTLAIPMLASIGFAHERCSSNSTL
jgi:hypothetical protein